MLMVDFFINPVFQNHQNTSYLYNILLISNVYVNMI